MALIVCIPYATRLDFEKFQLNVTSRVRSPFSPFLLRTPMGIVENVWQFSKVYREHIDENGKVKDDWYQWRQRGLQGGRAVKNPMGKGRRPEFFIWNDRQLSYIDARREIYIPVYSNAVMNNARWEFHELVEIWNDLRRGGEDLYLRDFDGYDRHKLNMSIDDVINCETRHMGHCFVLESMILSNSPQDS